MPLSKSAKRSALLALHRAARLEIYRYATLRSCCYDKRMKQAWLNGATEIIAILQSHGIDPVVYGSLGVSLYLGPFKTFNDVDLLIDDQWLDERWDEFKQLLSCHGFILLDEREHEFKDAAGRSPSFARKSILVRDKIMDSLDELVTVRIGNLRVKTLSPASFVRAYEFSAKDGYRQTTRHKNDRHVVSLLEKYIASQS